MRWWSPAADFGFNKTPHGIVFISEVHSRL
jgi:hypothetical protein